MTQSKINRRKFFNNSVTLGAFSLVAGNTFGLGSIVPVSSESKDTYQEPKKSLPIYGRFDVIVVGGGPAGWASALASARNGAKTLIIEKFPFFGGTATASLMLCIVGYRNQVKPDHLQTSKGISEELILRLKEIKGLGQSSSYDPAETYSTTKGNMTYSYSIDGEKTKYMLTKMLHDEGVNILFHTIFVDSIMEGNNIIGIVVENKSGRQAIFGKVIIDASGDADVAHRAGVPYWQAEVGNGNYLKNCLMYKVRIDPKNSDKLKGIIINSDKLYWGPNSNTNCVNADDLTKGEIETRLAVFDHFKKNQEKESPLLDGAYISETAPMLGIRQTRFIKGLYQISNEDVLEGKKFDDSIAMSAQPIINYYGYRRFLEHTGYEIPYRCMLPQKVEGLLVTGRCMSTDQQAYESWRAMAPVMCLGEAAGTAAALCVKSKKLPKEVDVEMLQSQLKKQGAEIGQNNKS
ncbi:MAG TPA: FAD-dependent oxidoreductase [Prolixibacteraceae bacterium]|nr:FAD-dependent oxidoreductase [Prolixibacteraceae bacterium]